MAKAQPKSAIEGMEKLAEIRRGLEIRFRLTCGPIWWERPVPASRRPSPRSREREAHAAWLRARRERNAGS
jgi:hypothetical protein